MTIDIELDTYHHLDEEDCLEICGIVLNKIFEVVFLLDDKPKFKFSIDHTYGWDVSTWGKTTCDMDSGSNSSFLEYFQSNQFTLCFHIKCNQILTLLNDNVLSTTEILSPIQDINSIKISGNNLITYISFSDCYKKTSRVLQPAIHKSLKSNNNNENESVTIIESRKRIIFLSNNSVNNGDVFLESDNESDDEAFIENEINLDFKWFNTASLRCIPSKDEEFSYQYPSQSPENKYVINYFIPQYSVSDSDEIAMTDNEKNIQFFEMENKESSKEDNQFNELKSKLEKIKIKIDSTGNEISRIKSLPSLGSIEDDYALTVPKVPSKRFQIPVWKTNTKSLITKKSINYNRKYNNSKIPILTKYSSINSKTSNNNVKSDSINKDIFENQNQNPIKIKL